MHSSKGRSDSFKLRDHLRQTESREFVKAREVWHETGSRQGAFLCGQPANDIRSVCRGTKLPEPACQKCAGAGWPLGVDHK